MSKKKFKMYEKIFLVLILCSKFLIVISWEPKADYCKVKCAGQPKAEHTACDCKVIKPREIIDERLKEFRQEMVNVHNKYRNQIASGAEKDKGYPEAANMMALSYNLELEYIAKCHAGKFIDDHDKCRKIADAPASAGQNLAGNSDQASLKSNVTGMAWRWYNELNDVKVNERKDFIKNYSRQHAEKDKKIGHFSQFVWWSHKLLGCARVYNKESKEDYWKNTLICNYGGATEQNDAGNLPGKPIYQEGPKCSACPKGTACNPEYPALCGPVAEVTAEKVPLGKPSSQTARIYQNKLLLLFVLLVLNLN